MLKCKYFEELILTSSIDGEISAKDQAQLDAHLALCSSCAKLAAEVRDNLVQPFQAVARQDVPSRVWDSIKEEIEKKNSSDKVSGFMDFGRAVLSWPQWIPPVAVALMLTLVATAVFQVYRNDQVAKEEQIQYLASFWDPSDEGKSVQRQSQTWIEEYFL